jgi:hypothetical protein
MPFQSFWCALLQPRHILTGYTYLFNAIRDWKHQAQEFVSICTGLFAIFRLGYLYPMHLPGVLPLALQVRKDVPPSLAIIHVGTPPGGMKKSG